MPLVCVWMKCVCWWRNNLILKVTRSTLIVHVSQHRLIVVTRNMIESLSVFIHYDESTRNVKISLLLLLQRWFRAHYDVDIDCKLFENSESQRRVANICFSVAQRHRHVQPHGRRDAVILVCSAACINSLSTLSVQCIVGMCFDCFLALCTPRSRLRSQQAVAARMLLLACFRCRERTHVFFLFQFTLNH